MSRSYKHTPRSGESKGKLKKRYANHKVRRMKLSDIPQHAGYRKLYDRWNICDYEIVGVSFNAYYRNAYKWWANWWRYRTGEPEPDMKSLKKEYDKWYIRK